MVYREQLYQTLPLPFTFLPFGLLSVALVLPIIGVTFFSVMLRHRDHQCPRLRFCQLTDIVRVTNFL